MKKAAKNGQERGGIEEADNWKNNGLLQFNTFYWFFTYLKYSIQFYKPFQTLLCHKFPYFCAVSWLDS